MKQLWNCILGPRLYRIYSLNYEAKDSESSVFRPNLFERYGNNILKGVNVMWNVGLYTSPLIISYFYKKNYFCFASCVSLGKWATGISLLIAFAMVIRGIGRSTNTSYKEFLKVLLEFRKNQSPNNKEILYKYDFDFWAWPADYSVRELDSEDSKSFTQVEKSFHNANTPFWWLFGLPCNLATYCCIHLFGRHLIFPGSIQFIQSLMEPMLADGREKLVVEYKGSRNKVLTRDGNYIDTMFVDRRQNKSEPFGSTLVVCCEGNAGFYEVGLMSTPLDAGYSVLGWNHPGFAGSSGTPFPSQEQHAVDTVMQFAINKLGFRVDEIMIYAWSIGGYSGTWAAMNYPEIQGLVVDATFDDILPLAVPRMPQWMGGLVKATIRRYMNLNISDQLQRFPGPVSIIRRTGDEIITTVEGDISTNRGNHVLLKLLSFRFPNLHSSLQASETLRQWVIEDKKIQDAIYNSFNIEEELLLVTLASYIQEKGHVYPLHIGEGMDDDQKTKLLLFIAKNILVNYDSTHNTPLPAEYFKMPWTPLDDPSFIQL